MEKELTCPICGCVLTEENSVRKMLLLGARLPCNKCCGEIRKGDEERKMLIENMEGKDLFAFIEGVAGKQRNFIFFDGYKVTANEFDTQIMGDYYLEKYDEKIIRFDVNEAEKTEFIEIKKNGIKQTMLNGKCLILFYENGVQLGFWLTEDAIKKFSEIKTE
jgi:hypothetical protein